MHIRLRGALSRSSLFTTHASFSSSNWICGSCALKLNARRNLSTESIKQPRKPYYVTTPIFYVNADPHVGHLYTLVLGDVLKRWQVLRGAESIFQTGTDEHGMKIQQASAKAGIDPKSFCDRGAEVFRTLASRAHINADHFIRTTDREHKEAVAYAWCLLKERDYIYTSKHEGWYSISDETFFPQSRVHLIVEPQTGRKIMASIETGNEVGWTSEVNYRFRLSAFRDRLLEYYRNNPEWIAPQARMDEVVQAVTDGLEDISISRPTDRLSWGIRVPDDESQTIYVWLDALVNYITVAGYPWPPGQEHVRGWPADCHIIGKEIVRFHCIYWPAFLMALSLPLPKRILTHAHWTLGRAKMAKSKGNAVNPFFALDRFGVDVMRFYLALEGGIKDDTDYSNYTIIARYKSLLSGLLGNLTSRVLRHKGWSVRHAIERTADKAKSGQVINNKCLQQLDALAATSNSKMEELNPGTALSGIFNQIGQANKYFVASSPWKLAKAETTPLTRNNLYPGTKQKADEESAESPPDLDTVVFTTVETLRIAGILLQPFMPGKASHLLDMLGVEDDRRSFKDARVGGNLDYGVSRVNLGKGHEGVLFPPLASDV